MLDWLKRLVGNTQGRSANDNSAGGLSNSQLASIAEDLDFLSRYGAELPQRSIAYLVGGQDESVLGDLAGLPASAGEAYGLASCHRIHLNNTRMVRRRTMFAGLNNVAPNHHLRLAKIFEAIGRRDRKDLWLDWLAGVPVWLDVYIQEAFCGVGNVLTQKDRESDLHCRALRADASVGWRRSFPHSKDCTLRRSTWGESLLILVQGIPCFHGGRGRPLPRRHPECYESGLGRLQDTSPGTARQVEDRYAPICRGAR